MPFNPSGKQERNEQVSVVARFLELIRTLSPTEPMPEPARPEQKKRTVPLDQGFTFYWMHSPVDSSVFFPDLVSLPRRAFVPANKRLAELDTVIKTAALSFPN